MDSVNKEQDNFFSQGDNFFLQSEHRPGAGEHSKRLNDYDYNILKEDAYKDISSEAFKLEYKISRAEEELNELDIQIQTAKDVRDFILVEKLMSRKKLVQDELDDLVELYNASSLSAKISGGLTTKLREQFSGVRKYLDGLNDVLISKLPKRFSNILELKKSLNKLENISKSVDELMTLQTPYGEAGDKYEQLSRYITRANNIQAEISKVLRT